MREVKTVQHFARSMSLADAMSPDNLLCYEMNGAPLPAGQRLSAAPDRPGLVRHRQRQVADPDRGALEPLHGPLHGPGLRDLREEQQDGETVWRQTSVGRALLKSAPAKVTRSDGSYRIIGAAWGAPIARVEVRIDDGPWQTATHRPSERGGVRVDSCGRWTGRTPRPASTAITSRAIDTAGNVQPAPDDPVIADKHTYWESNGQVTRRVGI